jgi:hypothetical protein
MKNLTRITLDPNQAILEDGALIVLDENKKRIRILPL